MHLILTGGTGMVGSAVLYAMLRDPSITRISVLSRRPVPQAVDTAIAREKCTVHLHPDFACTPSDPALMRELRNAHGCVWALGVSIKDVNKEKYEEITLRYPLVWAEALGTAQSDAAANEGGEGQQGEKPKHFNFVYVSGEGATTTPGLMTPSYGPVKGRAEAALLALSKEGRCSDRLRVYSARPGAVDYKGHVEIQKYFAEQLPWWKKAVYRGLFPAVRLLYKEGISPTKELGEALVKLAAGAGEPLPEGNGVDGEGRTLGNVALRRLVGL